MSIQTEYRGETITYNKRDNTWTWQGARVGLISLEAAEKSIDRALDGAPERPKFKKRKAILCDISSFKDCEVTSQDTDGSFWVSYTDRFNRKERTKKPTGDVFADTPENREKISQINDKRQQVEILKEEVNAIKKSLQPLSESLKAEEASA